MKSEKITDFQKVFVQGYACAIASMTKGHGSCTGTREALRECGIDSVSMLRNHGVCDYDIEILKPQIKEMQAEKRRSKWKPKLIC